MPCDSSTSLLIVSNRSWRSLTCCRSSATWSTRASTPGSSEMLLNYYNKPPLGGWGGNILLPVGGVLGWVPIASLMLRFLASGSLTRLAELIVWSGSVRTTGIMRNDTSSSPPAPLYISSIYNRSWELEVSFTILLYKGGAGCPVLPSGPTHTRRLTLSTRSVALLVTTADT